DALAGRLVGEACQALGAALAVVVNTLNPEVIVVTGGVARSLAPLQPEIQRQAAAYALPGALAHARIHIVGADKRQTMRGGAALVRYELARRATLKGGAMPKYVIEREVPGIGKWTPEQRRAAAAKSREVLHSLGPQIQWLHSYVTDDKLYCVYVAPSEELIRTHAAKGGFPANRISEVRGLLDVTDAEG
ncbi:MAG TPA: ROK family protein, partial [Methylomirabilota bacterium]|nr:ROK family protein [Methylomirabilota bacterium]